MESFESLLIKNIDESRKVIRFFLAKVIEPSLFEEIKKKFLKDGQKVDEQNRINSGIFSLWEFGLFFGSYKRIVTKTTIKKLVDNFMLETTEYQINHFQYYSLNELYVQSLFRSGVIENLLFGFQFIINKFRNSVFKIEHKDINGDPSIGTGYLIANDVKFLIITNEHVVARNHGLRLLSVRNIEYNFEIVFENEDKDIAILEIKLSDKDLKYFKDSHIPFNLKSDFEPLKEIITIGYPSIPLSKDAYQVYHKGEINSLIEDYNGNQLFIISAKTSSGNSGSPVIDNSGMVLGTITRELFDKGDLEKKGKLPYYAVIPSIETINCLNKL
jgi:S1-C subfamily serine protease